MKILVDFIKNIYYNSSSVESITHDFIRAASSFGRAPDS